MLMTTATTARGLAMAKKAKAASRAKKARSKKAGAKKIPSKKTRAAKKRVGRIAAKPAKRAKAPNGNRTTAAKPPRKVVAPKMPKATAAVTPPTTSTLAPAPASAPSPHESFSHRIGSAFKAVVDTLTEAEQLHHRLEPNPSRDPDPE